MKMNWFKKSKYLVPIAICVIGILCIAYYYFVGSFSKLDTTEYVYIDDNDNLDSVCVKLEPIASYHGLVAFKMLSRHGGYSDNIRSGRYAITPDQSTIRVFRNLKNGHQEPVRLTIPESRTMDRLAGYLSKKLMMDSVAVSILFSDSSFCAQQGYDTATIACLFVPNTYEVYWNISIENLMKRMKKENENFWNAQRTIKADALGLSKEEVCTIASIIDEETANNAEKPMIAGMYINRLNAGMPLQADPTIKFALKDFALNAYTTTCCSSTVPITPIRIQDYHRDLSRLHLWQVSTPYLTVQLTTICTCVPKKISQALTTLPRPIRST